MVGFALAAVVAIACGVIALMAWGVVKGLLGLS